MNRTDLSLLVKALRARLGADSVLSAKSDLVVYEKVLKELES